MRFALTLSLILVTLDATLGQSSQDAQPPSEAEQLYATAMRFELDGENRYRNMTLRAALKSDPDLDPAHWHLGELQQDDAWIAVRDLIDKSANLEVLREYANRRNGALGNPASEFELAQWCRSKDLVDRERLHLMRVAAHPSAKVAHRKSAAKRLHLRQYAGMALTEQQFEQIAERTKDVNNALDEWSVQVRRWKTAIASGKRKGSQALQLLAEVDDPRAIAALEIELSPSSEALALAVVQVLDRIDHPDATMSLVRHALGAPWPSVAAAASRALKKRPMHEYVPTLMANLDTPIHTSFKVVATHTGGGSAMVRQEQVFFKEGVEQNHVMVVNSIATPWVSHRNQNHGHVTTRVSDDPSEWGSDITTTDPTILFDDRAARALEQQARAVGKAKRVRAQLAAHNERIAASNERTFNILETATRQVIPRSPTAWADWWRDYNEVTTAADYYYGEPEYKGKPTNFVSAFLYGQYSSNLETETHTYGENVVKPCVCSCFRAQTLVWTETGRVPIEQVSVGDRVVSKDPDTGALEFNIVLAHTLRPPAEIVQVKFDQGNIECTKGHPFWVSGVGWRMAKLLAPGDRIHALESALEVREVNSNFMNDQTHNLFVDKASTYLVGELGLLVHDNTYRRPTRAVIPGYRKPTVKSEPDSVAGR